MEEEIKEIKLDSPVGLNPANQESNLDKNRPRRRLLLIILGVFLFLGFAIGLPLFKAYTEGKVAYASALAVRDALKSSDLAKAKAAMLVTTQKVKTVHNDLNLISWLRPVPFIGGYVSDALHLTSAAQYGLEAGVIIVEAAEPYADLLGLKGQENAVAATAEDRIAKAVETLDKVTPEIDKVADKMALVKKEIDNLDPNRYPKSFFGKSVRPRVVEAKELVTLSDQLLTSARPMVKKLPELLGARRETKYLVLFQNDKELRPTGGFITAYAVFRVEKGRFYLETSDDIYKLDDTVTSHVAPPDPISRYLNVFGWRLRDANFSPDFSSSMKTFEDIYANSSAKKTISGIIAVDTHFLTSLVDVLGPIKVYGTNFTSEKVAACDCPMVIYELLKEAGTPRNYWTDSRKDMIGVLLQAIMRQALDAPSQMNAKIFQTALTAARQKHILIYLHDPDAQGGVEALGLAGRIKVAPADYLHVSDANLAGAKSNLYLVENVKQEVTVTASGANVNLVLEYKYPHEADNCSLERKGDLCLAGIYRDYLRVYLPKGATISQVRGFENKSTTFEDLGHTVIDGFFTVVPQGLAKIEINYFVPGDFKKNREYKSLIQKQPGTVGNHYAVTVNGKKFEFDLTEDKELSVPL